MRQKFQTIGLPLLFLCCLVLLAACGGAVGAQGQKTPVPAASPSLSRGQQLLAQSAQLLNSAKTLHGVFQATISGQFANGTAQIEIWRQTPDESRTVVLKSTLSEYTSGSLLVDNGKQIWQYDPAQKLVYTGSASVPSSATGTPTPGTNANGNLDQLILNIVQTIFNQSTATLTSSSQKVNGHAVYTIQVASQSQASSKGLGSFSYSGTVSIDQQTHLPLALSLNSQGFGQIQLTIPTLALNGVLASNLFSFTPPPGTKVLPLPAASSSQGGTLTLPQAEQQAGYHLLSVPASQTTYHLLSINALGAPGSQIYTFNYTSGSQNFTLSEGKSLANLPVTGQTIGLRGTHATFVGSSGTNTLSWTEQGVGIQIAGPLTQAQITAVANLLK
jgi:outer membrane lipoprotein-sorting protein